jgi:hypothetical protein
MKKPQNYVGAWLAGVRFGCKALVETGSPRSMILPELLALVIMEINKAAAAHLEVIDKIAQHHLYEEGEKLRATIHFAFTEGGRFTRDCILIRKDINLAFASDEQANDSALFVLDSAHKEADKLFGKLK